MSMGDEQGHCYTAVLERYFSDTFKGVFRCDNPTIVTVDFIVDGPNGRFREPPNSLFHRRQSPSQIAAMIDTLTLDIIPGIERDYKRRVSVKLVAQLSTNDRAAVYVVIPDAEIQEKIYTALGHAAAAIQRYGMIVDAGVGVIRGYMPPPIDVIRGDIPPPSR